MQFVRYVVFIGLCCASLATEIMHADERISATFVPVVALWRALFGAPCLNRALCSNAVWEKAREMALQSPTTCLTRMPFCGTRTSPGDLARFQTTLLQTRTTKKVGSPKLAPVHLCICRGLVSTVRCFAFTGASSSHRCSHQVLACCKKLI